MTIENLLENLVIEAPLIDTPSFKLLNKLEFATLINNPIQKSNPSFIYFIYRSRQYCTTTSYLFEGRHKEFFKDHDLLLLKANLIVPFLKECKNLEDVNIILNLIKPLITYQYDKTRT